MNKKATNNQISNNKKHNIISYDVGVQKFVCAQYNIIKLCTSIKIEIRVMVGLNQLNNTLKINTNQDNVNCTRVGSGLMVEVLLTWDLGFDSHIGKYICLIGSGALLILATWKRDYKYLMPLVAQVNVTFTGTVSRRQTSVLNGKSSRNSTGRVQISTSCPEVQLTTEPTHSWVCYR